MKFIYKFYILFGRTINFLATPMKARTSRAYAIIVSDKKEVLLVKNWLGDGSWRLPGGGKKRSEAFAEGLARELREELRIDVPLMNMEKVTDGQWLSKRDKFKFEIFIININSEIKDSIRPKKIEIIATKWFSSKDLHEANLVPEILAALNKTILASKV